MTPQLSIQLRTFAAPGAADWAGLVAAAEAADRAGVDRVVLSDHVAFGEALADYADPRKGGVEGGRQPTGPDGEWLEPVTTIAYLAARTRRVRFGTNILLAALRRPAVLAKMASTIDVLSGGRLDLGVGVGWQRAEYEAAGLPFEQRGRLLDHTLEVCRSLWTQHPASVDDGFLAFERIHQMPAPLQADGVPVWVSGTVQPAAMRRLANYGSGWIPWGADAADVVASIPRMRAAVEEFGRDPGPIGVVASVRAARDGDGRLDVGSTLAPVPGLVEAGVTDVRVSAALGEAELGELAGAFRALVT